MSHDINRLLELKITELETHLASALQELDGTRLSLAACGKKLDANVIGLLREAGAASQLLEALREARCYMIGTTFADRRFAKCDTLDQATKMVDQAISRATNDPKCECKHQKSRHEDGGAGHVKGYGNCRECECELPFYGSRT